MMLCFKFSLNFASGNINNDAVNDVCPSSIALCVAVW